MEKYLSLFKDIWNAPAGKQIIAILMILPIAVEAYHYFHNIELRSDITELKDENKTLNLLVIKKIEDCDDKVFRVDSTHTARFNAYRDNNDRDSRETIKELKADLRETNKALQEAKQANTQIQQIVNTKK